MASSSEVGVLKTTDLWLTKTNADSWRYIEILPFQFAYTHWAIFQDFECVHGFEKNNEPVHKAWKMHVYPTMSKCSCSLKNVIW